MICGKCAFRSPDGTQCGVIGMKINQQKDGCSFGKVSPPTCAICGKFIVGPSILDKNRGEYFEICGNCASNLSNCQTCDHIHYCVFETDPSPLPKVVTQTVRQGGMIMQTQARNPERIKATCAKNCACYHNDECCKEFNICGNHIHSY